MEIDFNQLGYSKKWNEFEILTKHELKNQLNEYETGEDSNQEHYRYKTLCDWMDNKASISTSNLLGLIDILKNDPDKGMATEAYFRLYLKSFLSNDQKVLLENSWIETNQKLKELIDTDKLKTKIIQGQISSELLKSCINKQQTRILKMILEKTNQKSFIEILKTYEHSKKIRNLANDKLKNLDIKSNE